MKLKVFAVKDAGADAFIPPFCLPTESMALREFANLAGNPEHNFGKYKNDYSLYLLGSFDDGSGLFELLPEPRFLMSADGRVAEQGLLFDRGLNWVEAWMRGVSQAHFSQVPVADIPRSAFDRSHGYKTTFDAGYLIPILVDEVLPGDTFNVRMTGFARLATPIYPTMDNLYMQTFFFAVPIRLVWDNFKKFMGEQTNPGDSIAYTVPQMVSPGGGYGIGSLSDYMGIPTGIAGLSHSSLWHRAYNLIWNEWFRDENLQNSVTVDKGNGPDTPGNYVVLQRGKRHDYFTSCLPWPQKGAAITLPLGTSAPVTSTGTGVSVRGGTGAMTALQFTSGAGSPPVLGSGATSIAAINFGAAGTTTTGLQADLSTATAATVNQLRQAFQLQRMLERDARGGTRYTEIVRSHFGVVSPDARLQRPEYLGGGTGFVNINPVAQTSGTGVTGSTTPQANLSAIGTATLHNHGFTKSFTEHCLIIGLMQVRADLTYQQGLNRMFMRSTRYDYYWPALSHIGEQAVTLKEIYAQGTGADDTVFGYQERYGEYRYKPSQITGLFRSTAAGTLDAWHLAQKFTAAPALNAAFIVDDPPVDRVIAVPSQPHFLFDAVFKMRCARPMPVYGVPGLIDHFWCGVCGQMRAFLYSQGARLRRSLCGVWWEIVRMAFLAALPGVISALAPAVATAGAAYMQSSSAAASYRRMNAANANLTFAQQMWEEMMRGSAHQAEVTDLQRAGLNPILSAGGGGGSWHSVNPIPQQPVPAKSVGDVGGTLVNTALALKNVELLEAQRDKTEAEAREVKQRVDENEVGERVQNIREDTRLKNYEYTMRNALAGPQLAKAVQEAGLLEQQYRRGSMTDDKLRQEVANLAQQYKIGESAEEQSRILRDIYKSDPGFLLKLLSVIKDLVK